ERSDEECEGRRHAPDRRATTHQIAPLTVPATMPTPSNASTVSTMRPPPRAAGQVVARLAQAGPREASLNLPEAVRPATGWPAQASVYGGSTARSPARLRQLADAADPMSRTYEARYVLDGAAAQAPLGATVTVWITGDGASESSEVPLGALF